MENISAIYSIKNILNLHIYIGSTKNFHKRKIAHLCHLRRGSHHSDYLQKAWDKYGESNFIFEVLEKCQENIRVEREQIYLDTLKPEYNICTIAGKTTNVKMKPHVQEALKKFRETYVVSEETKLRMSKARFGRKCSKEEIEKRIKTKKEKYNGDVMSSEARQRVIFATVNKPKKIKPIKIPKVLQYEIMKGKTLVEVFGEERAKEIGGKISASKKGKKYQKQTEEHIRKRSEKRKITFRVIDYNNNLEYEVIGWEELENKINIKWFNLLYIINKKEGFIKNLNIKIYRLKNLQ